jgi:hypothetical protein
MHDSPWMTCAVKWPKVVMANDHTHLAAVVVTATSTV